ncbi:tRNA (adenine(58)-N(1))-methyltransferase catalytic subunit TRMT61A-like [Limulus polyphemus]|uniref:tRNA (adenine(58)-N(1))-methyltransferase catalytic subunit TRMT61A n=1 Tax=Limulus polyphemus TaxID=6850 RepID=A0ABM1BL94_LIMPO|nr:tRNA (adenine(58)-N(1))-methyltransferase catalytic subunit TRMT61A-like [Limulus polyphemus]
MSFIEYRDLVKNGDTVLIYLSISNIYALKITSGKVFQTKYGALKHDSIIGKRYGNVVQCSRGWAYVLFLTPELWTLTLPHRTQILYTPDISLVILQLDLKPGKVVCEAGTGSGSLSHALARTIAPTGQLYTFDFHEQRVSLAREEFQEHGLGDIVTVQQRDVCAEGFGLEDIADAMFLDLPHPWEAIPLMNVSFRCSGGRLCSFSPCIEQVQKTCEALHTGGFTDITTLECLLRPFEVKEVSLPHLHLSEETLNKTRKISLESQDGTTDVKKEETGKINTNSLDDTTGDAVSFSKSNSKRSRIEKSMENVCEAEWAAVPSLQIPGHTGYLTFATFTHS